MSFEEDVTNCSIKGETAGLLWVRTDIANNIHQRALNNYKQKVREAKKKLKSSIAQRSMVGLDNEWVQARIDNIFEELGLEEVKR